jgi:hypothetical protein
MGTSLTRGTLMRASPRKKGASFDTRCLPCAYSVARQGTPCRYTRCLGAVARCFLAAAGESGRGSAPSRWHRGGPRQDAAREWPWCSVRSGSAWSPPRAGPGWEGGERVGPIKRQTSARPNNTSATPASDRNTQRRTVSRCICRRRWGGACSPSPGAVSSWRMRYSSSNAC